MASSVRTALLFLPGTAFWVLFGVGLATGNETLIGLSVVLMVVTIVSVIVVRIRAASAQQAELRRIWREGQPARARILALTGAGMMGDHPQAWLDLEVHPPGTPAYRTRVHAHISQLAVPRVQPACEIDVRLDPSDRSRVVVDPALTPSGYGD